MNANATHCHTCGAEFVPSGCSTGYAIRPDDTRICYACADKEQRAELLDRSKPFCAYVSCDGNRITTWTGGELMRITRSHEMRLTRQSFTHGKTIRTIRAIDVHGNRWFGRGNPGISIRLRPCKA